jgi:hypothetical protein
MSVTAYGQEMRRSQGPQPGVAAVPMSKKEVWHSAGHFRASPESRLKRAEIGAIQTAIAQMPLCISLRASALLPLRPLRGPICPTLHGVVFAILILALRLIALRYPLATQKARSRGPFP